MAGQNSYINRTQAVHRARRFDLAVLSFPFAILSIIALAASLQSPWPSMGIAVISLLLFLLIFFERTGRIPALALALFLWTCLLLPIQSVLASAAPDWAAWVLTAGMAFAVAALTGRIAVAWGRDRQLRRKDPIIEWEWVYTGRDFSRSHPEGRLSIGILLTLVAIFFVWFFIMQLTGPIGPVLHVVYLGLCIMTTVAALRRSPITYPLVFFLLVPGFPFTAPFMVYWADGVRPNLIYRHRYERLVPAGRPA